MKSMDASLRILAGVAILLPPLMTGCAAQTPVAPRLPVPTVTLVLPTDRPLEFGALERLQLTIRNVTPEAVLLDSVILDGQLAVFQVEPISIPGAVRENRAAKHFLYNPDTHGETPPIFTDGWLLFPGEAVSVEPLVRLRHFVQQIQLRYRPIPIRECMAEVYFARPDRRRSGRYRFERISQTEIGFYYRAERGTLDRLVIVGDESFWPLMATDTSVRVNIQNFAAPGELVAAIGASVRSSVTRWIASESIFEESDLIPGEPRQRHEPLGNILEEPRQRHEPLGLWIVDDPDARRTIAVRVDENGPVETFDLPRCELTIFDILDLAADEFEIPVYEAANPDPVQILTARDTFEFMNTLAEEGKTLRVTWTTREDAFFDYGLLMESAVEDEGIGDPRFEHPRFEHPRFERPRFGLGEGARRD